MFSSIIDFFISSAHAAPAQAAGQEPSGFPMMLMLGIFLAFMYFGVMRPQNKRAREHRNLITSLQKGDEVVTNGGLLGKITKITDGYINLEISTGTEVTLQKNSIANVLPKGTLKSI